jgi:hypothetical protein
MTRDADSAKFPFLVTSQEAIFLSYLLKKGEIEYVSSKQEEPCWHIDWLVASLVIALILVSIEWIIYAFTVIFL